MSVQATCNESPPDYEEVIKKFIGKNIIMKDGYISVEKTDNWTSDMWDIKKRLPDGVEICEDVDEIDFPDRIIYVNHNIKKTSWSPFAWGDIRYKKDPCPPLGLANKSAIRRRANLSIEE